MGAAGNAAEHGSHLQVICGVTGIVRSCSESAPGLVGRFPQPVALRAQQSIAIHWYGMEWIAIDCIPIHSIANAFHRNGTHTIGMDTNGVDAHGVAAAGGRVAGTTWLFRWRIGGKTAARAEKPASVGAAKWPFTHGCSLRDNRHYRASFPFQNHPRMPPSETRP